MNGVSILLRILVLHFLDIFPKMGIFKIKGRTLRSNFFFLSSNSRLLLPIALFR
jgi:hypothetical protein